MTYALIDNATLTAVQRIEGKVATRSADSVDTDLVALENLIQAILFYDDVIAIDDYIPEHRDDRINSFPFIRFLSPSDFKLDEISDIATDKASEIKPEIRGGEFANEEFKSLLELLKTHIVCTWDISSSVYYLTLKGLSERGGSEFKKYGNLAAAIFSELGDAQASGKRIESTPRLVDRYGEPITEGYTIPNARWGAGSTGGMTEAVKAFAASLVWLANRSIYYSLAGSYLKADTFIYPIRQTYQQHYLGTCCEYGRDFSRRIVGSFSESLGEDLLDVHNAGLASATAMDIPLFSAWLTQNTGDPSLAISSALDLRERQDFVEARGQLKEIRLLCEEQEIVQTNKKVTKILCDLRKLSKGFRESYGVETKQGIPVTRLVNVYNTVAAVKGLPQLPAYDINIKLPEFMRGFRKASGFSAVYRNVGQDLATVWSLGGLRDLLGSKVVEDSSAIAYNPKQEEPRFRNFHSRFKSPM